jgi:hypothetical protein
MLRRVAVEITDVSEELSASFIRVTRIGELGTTLAVTRNRRTLRRNTKRVRVPGAQPVCYSVVIGNPFPGAEVKRPGPRADLSLPACAEIKKPWVYASTSPYTFMA